MTRAASRHDHPQADLARYAGILQAAARGRANLIVRAKLDRVVSLRLRDFALLLMMSTYGFSAGEVVRLQLQDIDWSAGYAQDHTAEDRSCVHTPPVTGGGQSAGTLSSQRPAAEHTDQHVFVRMTMPSMPSAVVLLKMSAARQAMPNTWRPSAILPIRSTVRSQRRRPGCARGCRQYTVGKAELARAHHALKIGVKRQSKGPLSYAYDLQELEAHGAAGGVGKGCFGDADVSQRKLSVPVREPVTSF